MQTITSNQPNAAKLLESLRSSGYDNYSALADLIDNSFDANADTIKVDVGEGAKSDYLITISDNGDGMDSKTLDQALRLGSMTDQNDENLGKYGMGLITASISIGRRLVVITKKEGKYYTGIHDLDDIALRNEFIKEVRESTEIEKNTFMVRLGAVASGTVVMIQKIDNLQNKNMTSFSNTLIKHCGEIFRDFLEANKVLTVNRKIVHSIDPMLRKDSGTSELVDKTKEFTGDNGESSTVRLRVYHLPNLTKTESEDRKINWTNQGFYLMRNNRQIAGGESLGIFTKHNDFNRFRAEIYFDGGLDRKIGVNFKKQNVSLSEDIKSWVALLVKPQIDSIRDIAKKNQQKSREEKVSIDHTPTQRMIASRKSVLKKPKIDEKNVADSLKAIRTDDFANIEFKEQHNTHLAPLFQISILGEKITINYNADHIFYQTIFMADEENKELINAIDSFIYSASLALISITATEESIHLKDEFLDQLSDNLRSLLT